MHDPKCKKVQSSVKSLNDVCAYVLAQRHDKLKPTRITMN